MQELEDLAEAFFHFWHHTRLDHDWDNESPVPFGKIWFRYTIGRTDTC